MVEIHKTIDNGPSVARPWEGWLTHAATAAVASALTWALAAWLWAR